MTTRDLGPLTVPRTCVVGDVSVRVWAPEGAGPGADPAPVVLAFHGWTDSGATYGRLWQHLGRRPWLVAPDAPGHGGRAWSGARQNCLSVPVTEALAVLDRLGDLLGGPDGGPAEPWGPVALLGHSLGALTAARVAAERPGAADVVVLEEPPRRPLRLQYQRRRQRAWVRRLQATDHEGRVELARTLVDWAREDLDEWARSKDELDLASLDAPVVWGEELLDTIGRIREPVVLLLGRDGTTNVTDRWARAFLRKAPAGSGVVRIAAGHNPRRDNPEHFAQELWRVLLARRG